jgi:hypothetical protein
MGRRPGNETKEDFMSEEKSPIKIKKIGHVVLSVSDIERSKRGRV